MRMIMHLDFPGEPFNSAVRDGTAGKTMEKILKALKPEAAWFTEQDGHRGGILVVDVKKPSDIPGLAEPWFLAFDAEVRFRIAMTADDLGKAGLEKLGKEWG